jgi:hypothetical protein
MPKLTELFVGSRAPEPSRMRRFGGVDAPVPTRFSTNAFEPGSLLEMESLALRSPTPEGAKRTVQVVVAFPARDVAGSWVITKSEAWVPVMVAATFERLLAPVFLRVKVRIVFVFTRPKGVVP